MSAPGRAEGHADAWLRAMPVVFVLIWSTGFIVARYGMPHAPPLGFLAVRYGLSALCFAAWIALARVAWPQGRAQWLHLAATGVLLHAGYLGGVWLAVKLGLGAGLAALIVGLQPVLTALWMSGQGAAHRVSTRQWAGLVLGLAGLLLVPFVVIEAFTPLGGWRWHPELGFAMAWSVLALTLGGSSLLYLLIQRGAATQVTSLMYLVPPCTAVLAWGLFGESLGPGVLLGLVLTAAGVALVVRSPAPAPAR